MLVLSLVAMAEGTTSPAFAAPGSAVFSRLDSPTVATPRFIQTKLQSCVAAASQPGVAAGRLPNKSSRRCIYCNPDDCLLQQARGPIIHQIWVLSAVCLRIFSYYTLVLHYV